MQMHGLPPALQNLDPKAHTRTILSASFSSVNILIAIDHSTIQRTI